MLPILVPKRHADVVVVVVVMIVVVVIVINGDGVDARKGAHARICTAPSAGLLRGALEPAELVGVFARVLGDASALEGAEDVVASVVFDEVFLVFLELVSVVFQGVFLGFQGVAGVCDLLGFAA